MRSYEHWHVILLVCEGWFIFVFHLLDFVVRYKCMCVKDQGTYGSIRPLRNSSILIFNWHKFQLLNFFRLSHEFCHSCTSCAHLYVRFRPHRLRLGPSVCALTIMLGSRGSTTRLNAFQCSIQILLRAHLPMVLNGALSSQMFSFIYFHINFAFLCWLGSGSCIQQSLWMLNQSSSISALISVLMIWKLLYTAVSDSVLIC
jgi:hypothetical protein